MHSDKSGRVEVHGRSRTSGRGTHNVFRQLELFLDFGLLGLDERAAFEHARQLRHERPFDSCHTLLQLCHRVLRDTITRSYGVSCELMRQ